jgi:hypothetical protein
MDRVHPSGMFIYKGAFHESGRVHYTQCRLLEALVHRDLVGGTTVHDVQYCVVGAHLSRITVSRESMLGWDAENKLVLDLVLQ